MRRLRDSAAGLTLVALAATATLVLLQAYRVFVPYLVFEIDQSERTTLAAIAVTVFGLTFGGAFLFRLLGPRATLAVAVGMLVVSRLCVQLSSDPGIRWKFAAAAIVASFWLFIVVAATGRPSGRNRDRIRFCHRSDGSRFCAAHSISPGCPDGDRI